MVVGGVAACDNAVEASCAIERVGRIAVPPGRRNGGRGGTGVGALRRGLGAITFEKGGTGPVPGPGVRFRL